MIILEEMPIIITKDKHFLEELAVFIAEPGAVILLPEDAILVKAPREEQL